MPTGGDPLAFDDALLSLARPPFLAAVTGYPGSATAADRLADERLAGMQRDR